MPSVDRPAGLQVPAGVVVEQVGYGHPDAVRLIAEVQAEYVVRYGSPDESPVDPLLFDPPHGTFFVVRDGAGDDGEAVAMGGWRRKGPTPFDDGRPDPGAAELKRMYVVPHARGRGLARALLALLERSVGEAGLEAVVLETGIAQPEAIALYTSAGYRPIPGFGHYAGSPSSRCFGKRLGR